ALRRRNSVNDLAVHRRAEDAGITPVSFERRLARFLFDEPLGFFLKVHRRDSRLYKFPQRLQHFVDDKSGAVHFFELFRTAQMDRHVARAPACRSKRSAKPVPSLLPRFWPHPPDATGQAACSTPRAATSASRRLPDGEQ